MLRCCTFQNFISNVVQYLHVKFSEIYFTAQWIDVHLILLRDYYVLKIGKTMFHLFLNLIMF